MIIEMFGGKHLRVSEEVAHKIDRLLDLKTKPERIKIEGQSVRLSEITNLWTDEQWATMEHERAGDFQCSFGFWHARREPCGHTAPVEPPADFSSLRNGTFKGRTPYQEKMVALMKFNNVWLTERGVYGPFRTPEEWDLYQSDGVMPEPPPRKPTGGRLVTRPKASAFPVGGKPEYETVKVFDDPE